MGGSVVGIATIATVALLNSGPKNDMSNTVVENAEVKKEICIQPPIAGKETPYTTYRISAKNGGVINYPTGSSISIPANAFVNTNGEPVSDSIDIKYREFHNPLEIFLSGIPMTYDSAGVTRTLESAGDVYKRQIMRRVIQQVEKLDSIYHREHLPQLKTITYITDSICYNACTLSHHAEAKAIISMTNSGYTAFKLSSHRPKAHIFIFTDNLHLLTTLSLVWGVRGRCV